MAEEGTKGHAVDPDETEVTDRYRKIFRHSNDAIVIVDLEAESFVDANPAACEMLGYTREELLELSPDDMHPGDIDQVREEFLSQVLSEGKGFTDDLACVTKNGQTVPTEISGAVLDTDDGDEPSRMVAVLHDVSERIRRQRELESQIERLDRFADIVSHDIRNPLNVIQSRATLAEETGDVEHVEAICDAADRIDEMLTNLLRLSRAGNVIGEQSTVDLEQLCREARDSVDAPGATLTVESTLQFSADRARTLDLLANLFENSVEHSSTGSRASPDDSVEHSSTGSRTESGDAGEEPSVEIRVGALADGNGFYVEDDGPGIPEDDRERIFEWGATTDDEGTGFGLTIVDQVATAHGWTVSVTDAADGGARFEFTGVETGAP